VWVVTVFLLTSVRGMGTGRAFVGASQ